jgi:hypothetical protein
MRQGAPRVLPQSSVTARVCRWRYVDGLRAEPSLQFVTTRSLSSDGVRSDSNRSVTLDRVQVAMLERPGLLTLQWCLGPMKVSGHEPS